MSCYRTVLLLGFLAAAAVRSAFALDFGPDAVSSGRSVFEDVCRNCHGLKYLGISPRMSEDSARQAFGRAPPDLSLMAAARGRGTSGAEYVVRLLTSYNDTPQENSVFPGIAMPPPIPQDDPKLGQEAAHVAAYLYQAAFPNFRERRSLGKLVLLYTFALTLLLYAYYRSVRRDVHG